MADCERCGGTMVQSRCISCGQYPMTKAEKFGYKASAAKKEREQELLAQQLKPAPLGRPICEKCNRPADWIGYCYRCNWKTY